MRLPRAEPLNRGRQSPDGSARSQAILCVFCVHAQAIAGDPWSVVTWLRRWSAQPGAQLPCAVRQPRPFRRQQTVPTRCCRAWCRCRSVPESASPQDRSGPSHARPCSGGLPKAAAVGALSFAVEVAAAAGLVPLAPDGFEVIEGLASKARPSGSFASSL